MHHNSRGYKDFLEGAALVVIPRCETTLINKTVTQVRMNYTM